MFYQVWIFNLIPIDHGSQNTQMSDIQMSKSGWQPMYDLPSSTPFAPSANFVNYDYGDADDESLVIRPYDTPG